MTRTKRKICLGCNQYFIGRVDSKTCSAVCRKRFQRARLLHKTTLQRDVVEFSNNRNYVALHNIRSYYAE